MDNTKEADLWATVEEPQKKKRRWRDVLACIELALARLVWLEDICWRLRLQWERRVSVRKGNLI